MFTPIFNDPDKVAFIGEPVFILYNGKDTIIHLQLGESHLYFGSIAAIFDVFSPDQIGITKASLWNFGITEFHPYKNKLCTIRKGTIQRKKKNGARSK